MVEGLDEAIDGVFDGAIEAGACFKEEREVRELTTLLSSR
jgi:hypothetical protein